MNLIYLLAPLVILLIGVTFLSLSTNEKWWIRVHDFPRIQYVALATLLLIAEVLLLDYSKLSFWLLFIPTLFVIAYHLWWILPYTRLNSREVPQADHLDAENSIKIMTANVLMHNKNVEKLIALVKENVPDILVTLETNQWWQDQLKAIESDYPYRISCPQENLYGMHVYSRNVLSESKTEFLVEDTIPSMHTLLTLPSGQDIRMHFLHPAPPSPTENDESSERDAELIMIAKSVSKADIPVIVTGDLNDVAWSTTTRLFRKISQLSDPRIGRGMFNTFHADCWFMRWPLDHLFHSRHFKLYDIRRLSHFGSDHFALLTQLIYTTNSVENSGSELEATKEDVKLARQKMASENVKQNDVPSPN